MLTVHTWKEHWATECALFGPPLGLNGLCCSMDFMHCHFLGWLQYFYGSTLSILVNDCLPDSPIQNLLWVGRYIKKTQRDRDKKFKQRLQKLTMFQPKKGFPKLRGRAADIQSLASAMLALFSEKMDADNRQHREIRLFLSLNNELDDTLDQFSPSSGFMAVPAWQAEKLFRTGLQMAQIHARLMDYYKGEGRKLFNMTSKTHFVLHCLHLSKYIHPKMTWCYKGETTMHRLQILWKSCLAGSKHWQVGRKAVIKERYRLWHRRKLRPVA